MAINFGQQINQALSSTLDRNQRGRIQAQRLAQQLREQQFNQRMKSMVQELRQKQFQLAQEAQTEEMLQNAIQNRLAKDREDRLNRLTNARIKEMGEDDSDSSGGGNSDYLRVTEVQTNNNQIESLNKRLAIINDQIASTGQLLDNAANQEGATMEDALSNPTIKQAGQEKIVLESKREQIIEQIQELRERNQSLFNRSENNQPKKQSSAPLDNL